MIGTGKPLTWSSVFLRGLFFLMDRQTQKNSVCRNHSAAAAFQPFYCGFVRFADFVVICVLLRKSADPSFSSGSSGLGPLSLINGAACWAAGLNSGEFVLFLSLSCGYLPARMHVIPGVGGLFLRWGQPSCRFRKTHLRA